MEELKHIKYYPDRFYICLDGFDLSNLNTLFTDLDIGEQQAVFIHEYYHYLTNITTFVGTRQFHVNFCDRFRIITSLTHRKGLSAYPMNRNNFGECEELLEYWQRVKEVIDEDDLDYNLVKEVATSPNGHFDIVAIEKTTTPLSVPIQGERKNGGRYRVRIEIEGLMAEPLSLAAYKVTGCLDIPNCADMARREYPFSNS